MNNKFKDLKMSFIKRILANVVSMSRRSLEKI